MKRKRLSKKPLGKQYLRYLISYTIVFLIPLCFLSFFYSSRFIKQFHEEVYRTVDLELQQFSSEIDNEITILQSIVKQISLSSTIRNFNSSLLEYQNVISFLSVFKETNNFFDEMFVILDDEEYVVSNSSTCEVDYLFNYLFLTEEYSSEQLKKLLSNITTQQSIPITVIKSFISNINPQKYILFIFPIFSDYQKHKGSIIFCVRQEKLYKTINSKLKSYNPHIIITNKAQKIASMGNENLNNKALYRSYFSSYTNWLYEAYIPNSQESFIEITKMSNDYMLVLFLVIFVSSIVIFFLQKYNYAPLKQLNNKAKIIMNNKDTSFLNNEVETIKNALTYLEKENFDLMIKVEDSAEDIKSKRLYLLLSGKYINKEEFHMDCSELDLVFPLNYYLVSIIYIENKTNSMDKIIAITKEYFTKNSICYYLTNEDPYKITLIQNLPTKDYLKSNFEDLQTKYEIKFNVKATISIGSIEEDFTKISYSFLRAKAGLYYRFVKGIGSLILSDEIIEASKIYIEYPYREFDKLKNALLINDSTAIEMQLPNIINFLKTDGLSLALAQSVCVNLLNLINNYCQNEKLYKTFPDMLFLADLETVDEVVFKIELWQQKFLTEYHDYKAISKDINIKEVNSYLDNNCLRCNFSIFEVAENFDMSLPVFSKFYKDKTNQNVVDYMISKRMDTAKHMLKETNLLLKDISEKVGYYNVSSFMRRFKILEGITPTDYRKLFKNK